MTTDRQGEAMKEWQSDSNKKARVTIIRRLFQEAGLDTEMLHVPDIKLETMDVDKYMINVLALAKIRQLRRIADYEEMQCPV